MDVIIFSGQSNMQGFTEGIPDDNQPIKNAMEYRLSTDALVDLKHPVGEDLPHGFLKQAYGGGGSILPAFCRAYVRETGRKVVAIHSAKGSTSISEWLYGTQCYHYLKEKILAGLRKTKEVGMVDKIFFVWLQGEADQMIRTTKEEYLERLISLKNQLKKDVGIEKFGIIRVGWFVGEPRANEVIIEAQEEAAKRDRDFLVLTRMCATLSVDNEYITPGAFGHYNNKATEMIGTEAGTALGKFRNYN
jgi:hypothetical protein